MHHCQYRQNQTEESNPCPGSPLFYYANKKLKDFPRYSLLHPAVIQIISH